MGRRPFSCDFFLSTVVLFYAALYLNLLVNDVEACLCRVIPNYSCPPPPHCCESGEYTFDECGCCMTCAKAELQECGGPSEENGKCASGLQCLKTCSKCIYHICMDMCMRRCKLIHLDVYV